MLGFLVDDQVLSERTPGDAAVRLRAPLTTRFPPASIQLVRLCTVANGLLLHGSASGDTSTLTLRRAAEPAGGESEK